MTSAIILAGGQRDALSAHAGVSSKALLEFQGLPLASYTLQALQAAPQIKACYYVGDSHGLEAYLNSNRVVAAGESFVASLENGLEAALADTSERLLISSADMPFVCAAAVDDFLRHAPDASFVYVAVRRDVIEAQFPGNCRTYARFREGTFTGGNMVLIKRSILPTLMPFAARAYNARKNPLALARMFGWGMLLRFMLGRLPVEQAEARASQLLQAPVRAFFSDYASLAVDIDTVRQLEDSQQDSRLLRR